MTENDIKLKAIAALTALRGGATESFVSDLLGEVIPDQFVVPANGSPEEVGLSMLRQLSDPLSALITGFILAFDAVADAYDEAGSEPSSEEILQQVALGLARDDPEQEGLD
ncbi:hypothetical protein [Streptomyces antimicrobicus]|uniref:Uncharacterized protein n=1 Tax=Streptomyces antimicrobicus TaxID=2883108 RepID=A0ABS8BFU4_9ACTN|nr:hypothetical protein [Streptomyces antimicrobicus]MCB5183393.1 hypothetical protein [Streptomyces antimicrobicus]